MKSSRNRTCDFPAYGSSQQHLQLLIQVHISLWICYRILLLHHMELLPCIASFLASAVQPLEQHLYYIVVILYQHPHIIGHSIVSVVSGQLLVQLRYQLPDCLRLTLAVTRQCSRLANGGLLDLAVWEFHPPSRSPFQGALNLLQSQPSYPS